MKWPDFALMGLSAAMVLLLVMWGLGNG